MHVQQRGAVSRSPTRSRCCTRSAASSATTCSPRRPTSTAPGFYGPGKYDGSVVNWVNGPLLQLVGSRRGFGVRFSPFTQRPTSNVKTLTAQVRD